VVIKGVLRRRHHALQLSMFEGCDRNKKMDARET
jgi:hypothetical protein